MKKGIIYLFAFVFICFLLPAMLTNTKKGNKKEETATTNAEINTNENETPTPTSEEPEQEYAYNKYGTIKLLHAKTGTVEEVALDNYLLNVVSAEMPADFEIEALKAQAVVARTYTIYKTINKKHDNADICDDSACCQAWVSKEDRLARWEEGKKESNWAKIEEAVNETKGIIVTYANQPINAFFHSNSGGITETATNVWGGGDYPYLQVVETSGEEGYTQYASEVVLTNTELLEKIKTKYPDITIDFANNDDLKILEHTQSGRVKTVKFGNHNISGNHELSGVETRTLLGLKSTNFEIIKEGENIKFSVKGYGHGVGMSQTGADAMAKQGSKYDEIIKHFYTGVELREVNSI